MLKVMVVDDPSTLRLVLRKQLMELGITSISMATDGAEALGMLVAALGIPHTASDAAAHVTVSIGAASFSSVCGTTESAARQGGVCQLRDVCKLSPADQGG
ncbi:MAG: hypothetical protein WCF85_22195 [Rhodospirillaceae bacterium]